MEMTSTPRTVEEIFKDYTARRTAIVRALSQGDVLSLSLSLSLFAFFFFLRISLNALIFSVFVLSDVDEFYGLCDPGTARPRI